MNTARWPRAIYVRSTTIAGGFTGIVRSICRKIVIHWTDCIMLSYTLNDTQRRFEYLSYHAKTEKGDSDKEGDQAVSRTE